MQSGISARIWTFESYYNKPYFQSKGTVDVRWLTFLAICVFLKVCGTASSVTSPGSCDRICGGAQCGATCGGPWSCDDGAVTASTVGLDLTNRTSRHLGELEAQADQSLFRVSFFYLTLFASRSTFIVEENSTSLVNKKCPVHARLHRVGRLSPVFNDDVSLSAVGYEWLCGKSRCA